MAKGFLGFAGRAEWGSGNTKPEDFVGEIFNTSGFEEVVLFRMCACPPSHRAHVLRIGEAPFYFLKKPSLDLVSL